MIPCWPSPRSAAIKNGTAIDEKRLIIAFLREIRDGKLAAITWELPDED